MNRSLTTAAVIVFTVLSATAQDRVDETALLSALRDSQPEVRSQAAQKLADAMLTDAIPAIMEAWSAEKDPQTKHMLWYSLVVFGWSLNKRAQASRGGQVRPAPFQACVPSEPRILSLTIEPPAHSQTSYDATLFRVSIRNLTEGRLAILAGSVDDMFSATVLGPSDARATIRKDRDFLYHPISELPPLTPMGHSGGIIPMLEANEETSFRWQPDFDMTQPGHYQIRLGGKMNYLDTTICSNTLDVTIE